MELWVSVLLPTCLHLDRISLCYREKKNMFKKTFESRSVSTQILK